MKWTYHARRFITITKDGDVIYHADRIARFLRNHRFGHYDLLMIDQEMQRIMPGAGPLAEWLKSPFQLELFSGGGHDKVGFQPPGP